jgi:N-acylneuraminate cytidylyltransferase
VNKDISKKIIAVITARKGSKRIKNKNIINFFGKPLIAYSITTAKKSNLFSKVFVSTDSLKIKKIAEEYGAEIPFLRKKKLSDDFSGTSEVVADFIKKMNYENYIICCIYPTAPLMRKKDLKKGLNLMSSNNYTFSANTTNEIKGNTFNIKNNFISKIVKKNKELNKNTLIDSGQFYWATAQTWIKRKKIVNVGASIIKIPKKYAQDLNDLNDLKILKKKFKKNEKNEKNCLFLF